MYGYIYLITNNITGLKYIGQHKYSKPEIDPKYFGSGKLLGLSVSKNGKENFTIQILDPINNVPTICDSRQELNSSEYYYTTYFNCVESDEYYNLVDGGAQGNFSLFVREVMSEKAKARGNSPSFTTKGTVVLHKGSEIHYVKKDQVELYLLDGYEFGKGVTQVPWNLNLKGTNDPRLVKNQENRKKVFDKGGSIGCCGLTGEDNLRHKKAVVEFNSRISNIDPEQFRSDYFTYGKKHCLTKYNFSDYYWEKLCNLFSIPYKSRKHRKMLENL